MKSPLGFGQLVTAAIALSSTASAWPGWLPDIDALIVRQATSTGQATATSTTGATATPGSTNSATATSTNTKNEPKTTNLNTGGQTKTSGTATESETGTTRGSNSNTTESATRTTFNAQDPAGGVTMISPITTGLGTQLYKIGDTVTWVWNYTSLQATPTALDVLVSCSKASATWTLTQNMSYAATGTYKWDTGAYQQTAIQSPLLVEQYTLLIYDAESAVTATAEAGYLSVYDDFKFGLYTPKPYSDLNEWKCSTCSGANSNLDTKALGFAVSMSIITILSFTWFVVGFGGTL